MWSNHLLAMTEMEDQWDVEIVVKVIGIVSATFSEIIPRKKI